MAIFFRFIGLTGNKFWCMLILIIIYYKKSKRVTDVCTARRSAVRARGGVARGANGIGTVDG